MSLDAPSYFDHLRAYLSDKYIVDRGASGEVTLAERYYREGETKKSTRKVVLPFKGKAFAIKLDGRKDALFHFLDDNGKEWSKRCDFVIFYVNGRAFHADCIEFKSKSLTAEKIVPQLRAGMCWVTSLKRTIDHYTGDNRRIRLRKFVFAENENPGAYLDPNRQLNADPSIRYYHFDEVNGQPLADLQNTSVQEI